MERRMRVDAIALRDADNVATALREIAAGEEVAVGVLDRQVSVQVRQAFPFGHKLAMTDLPQGTDIVKYGEVMGRATQAIPAGSHVHVHNIESLRGRGDLQAKEAGHGI
jgi:altronate dehydratase small subunit